MEYTFLDVRDQELSSIPRLGQKHVRTTFDFKAKTEQPAHGHVLMFNVDQDAEANNVTLTQGTCPFVQAREDPADGEKATGRQQARWSLATNEPTVILWDPPFIRNLS